MKVLVTGATGRVGANVVKKLADRGVAVRAMVTPGTRRLSKLERLTGVEVAEADLRDQVAINRACDGVTHVVHLAALMVLDNVSVEDFHDVNVLGTVRLLEGVLGSGGRIERFVLASTDSTYRPADPPKTPLTEDLAQNPADYYGTSKLMSEIVLQNRAHQFDIPYSVLRFGTVLSPEESPEIYRLSFLRGWLKTQQNQGRRSTLWPLFRDQPQLTAVFDDAVGNAPADAAVALTGPEGQWTLSVVDVRDAAEAVWKALTQRGALGRAFNIAAAEPVGSLTGASVVAHAFDVPWHVVRLPLTWRLEIDICAARRWIGYRPMYSYADMVRTAAANPTEARDFVKTDEGSASMLSRLSGG
ncbi:Nucleoside-diphosphate-sugar epimerase [Prauserella marina]|uniref:Nucleoside-diphosphate-sugar epimerase n=1 Tax=Prauserella marina TaxID=530584 RepID=A0A1G6UKF3_9PSEU|nr:NAD(P)-dependent oxidoreductase [Prauserella marina]PWV74744.1 nucleoside-diphosphate-sugar epimerase [Prauserella marina]SDD41838.1 Nucleoside-diphosphate-sugar epimerase [Prauserella marina]